MKLSLSLLLIVLLVGIIVRAQEDSTDYNKLSPLLRSEAGKKEPATRSDFLVHVQSPESFRRFLDSNQAVQLKYEYVPAKVFVIRTSLSQLFEKIIRRPEVVLLLTLSVPGHYKTDNTRATY